MFPTFKFHSRLDWIWTADHAKAFQDTKVALINLPTLACYMTKPTKLRTDGSQLNGIGTKLYEEHTTGRKELPHIYYEEQSQAAKNYHNIEVEMLEATWGCEKMNKYLHGFNQFAIETNHKPLISILNYKPLTEMSPCIQRM